MSSVISPDLCFTLQVNLTYDGVSVTSVSSEGVVYCQLPSTGVSRLRKCLQDIEAIFSSQVEEELLLLQTGGCQYAGPFKPSAVVGTN